MSIIWFFFFQCHHVKPECSAVAFQFIHSTPSRSGEHHVFDKIEFLAIQLARIMPLNEALQCDPVEEMTTFSVRPGLLSWHGWRQRFLPSDI